MGIRIDALDPTVLPSREHEVPAMKEGLTVKLTVGQILDLLVGAAPGVLDTLEELAAALGDDANFASTVTAALAARLEKAQNLADLPDKAAARTSLGVAASSDIVLKAGGSANATTAALWTEHGIYVRHSDANLGIIGRTGEYKGNSETNVGIFAQTGKTIEFAVNGNPSPAARFATDGELEFGTDPLSAAGAFGISIGLAATPVGPFIVTGTSESGSAVHYRFRSSGGTVGQITTNSTTTSYSTSSDYRLKDNVADLTGSGAFIDALRPVSFTWKIDGSQAAGFIAHEVQAVSPSSVVGQKDGPEMQTMQAGSSEIIANLVAEVQSLRQRVAQLEGAS